MRLGKVCISHSYIVDLDNQDMVDEAKDCFYEDICNAIKYDEIYGDIKVVEAPEAKESDIPEFLLTSPTE